MQSEENERHMPLIEAFYKFKFKWQRAFRGFDDTELYYFKDKFFLRTLEILIKKYYMTTDTEKMQVLWELITAFETVVLNDYHYPENTQEEQNALMLFAKYINKI